MLSEATSLRVPCAPQASRFDSRSPDFADDLCVISSVLLPVQRDLQLCPACIGDPALAWCTCSAKQLAVSSAHIGALVGSIAGGFLADSIGRRASLLLSDAGFMVGAAAMGMASSGAAGGPLFYCGRFLAGASLGMAGTVASTYIAESKRVKNEPSVLHASSA